jgi:uncharacterized membrane protein
MEIISGFLLVGGLITLVGAFLIYLSLRAGPREVSHREGVFYLGPIPIMVTGVRKWIITALGITSIILVWLVSRTLNLSILGWI